MRQNQSHLVLEWLQSSGGSYDTDCFGLTEFQGMGMGGVALKDIEPETTLFTIPNDLLLSSSTSSLRPLLTPSQWSSLEGPTRTEWPGLITAMMYEDALGSNSKWYGYLKTLPKTFDTPMFWKEEELEELKGTDIEGKLGKEQAEQDYMTKFLPLLQVLKSPFQSPPSEQSTAAFTIQDYHTQGSRILSRSFTVPHSRAGRVESEGARGERRAGMDGKDDEERDDEEEDSDEDDEEGEEQVMVPLADMLNAAYERDNARLYHEDGCLKMVSTKRILEGEQIYNTYGSPPNSDLLRKYGHLDVFPLSSSIISGLPEGARIWPFGNEGDLLDIAGDVVLEVVLGRGGMDKEGLREELMERVDWWIDEMEEDDTFTLGYPPDALPIALIAFTRLLNLSSGDWEKTKARGKVPKPKIDFEVDGGEVIDILKTVMRMRLEGYQGSLEEDLVALERHATDALPLPKFLALVLRTGERRVVLTVLGQLEAMQPSDQKRKAAGGEEESRKRQR